MNKKFKKLSTVMIGVIVSSAIMITNASAASVYLSTSESSDESSSIELSRDVTVSGKNEGSSKYSVYFITKYAEPGKGWEVKAEPLVQIGNSLGSTPYNVSISSSWKLELNPKGWGTKNCTANGQIK